MDQIPKSAVICLHVLAILALILVALGGFVRATGAGLACPDWPLCFGRVVPPGFGGGIAQEYVHRFTAALVSSLIGYLAVLGYRTRKRYVQFFQFIRIVLGILLIQILFGGLTVLLKVNPFIVTTHLLIGTIFFQLVAVATLELHITKKNLAHGYSRDGLTTFTLLLTILAIIQITLGGFVGSSGASLACDLPFCYGNIIPKFGPQFIQMFHRFLGVVIFIGSIFTAFCAQVPSSSLYRMRGHCLGVVLLISIQIIVGISNVWLQIPPTLTVAHLLLGQMILLSFLILFRNQSGFSILSSTIPIVNNTDQFQ